MNFKSKMTNLKHVYFRYNVSFHVVLLALAVLILYWPVQHFQFLIGWDDQWFVVNRFTAYDLTWDHIFDVLTSFYHGQYAPLNQLYYTMIHSLFGYDPAYYHLAGMLLHLINVVLIYFLINNISAHIFRKPKRIIRSISFFSALLFAILPLNIEPVAWISASKVLLYALFYLLALLSYCRYLSTSRPVYFYAAILCFILSFGAKEQAVMLPICLLLFDTIYNRDFKNKNVWFEKLPFFILALLFGLITIQSQVFYGGGRIFYPIYQRIPLALFTLMAYFTKCLFPVNLSYLYPYPFQTGEVVPVWMWLYVVAVPAVVYCFFKIIKIKWVFFGLLFFLIHVVLILNLFSLARYSFIADRYAYMANIGVCFLLSCFFVLYWLEIKRRAVLLVFAMLYLGSLMLYSHIHLPVWENAYTLKEKVKNTIEARPDYKMLKK